MYDRNVLKRKSITAGIFISLYILVPCIITFYGKGFAREIISEEPVSGKSVVINYKNASQEVDLEKFVAMVLAKRLSMSEEISVLKAESIMIRTDINRIMGENVSIDTDSLGMDYMTTKQMKNAWGKDYEDKYNLVMDCVASTSGMVIRSEGNLIDARYTQVSCGTTLSGKEILGDEYDYLMPVQCDKDMNSEDYIAVYTFSNKEFTSKLKKIYDGLSFSTDKPEQEVQIVSKSQSGYVLKIQVGNIVMTGRQFAAALGINSSCMTIDFMSNSIKITTKGKGEGMGVSIYSADIMAKNGSSYEEILQTFYNKISIDSE